MAQCFFCERIKRMFIIMNNNGLKIKIPNLLFVVLKTLLVLGGAWLVFSSISEITMTLLQHTEISFRMNLGFVFSILISFFSKIVFSLLLVIFAVFEDGKLVKFCWNTTAIIYSVYTLYTLYEYFRYNFSFSQLLNFCEFILYVSFLVSIALVCFYKGGVISEKVNKYTRLLCIFGVFHLVTTMVISFFSYGEMTISPILDSIIKLIIYLLFYAFGLIEFYTVNLSKKVIDERSGIDSDNDVDAIYNDISDELIAFETISIDDDSNVQNTETEFVDMSFEDFLKNLQKNIDNSDE